MEVLGSEAVLQLAQPTDEQVKPIVQKWPVKFSNVLLSIWKCDLKRHRIQYALWHALAKPAFLEPA